MAEKLIDGYCNSCGCDRVLYKPKVNHLAHGLASLILFNWFIPWFLVWFSAIFFNVFTGYRCKTCNRVASLS